MSLISKISQDLGKYARLFILTFRNQRLNFHTSLSDTILCQLESALKIWMTISKIYNDKSMQTKFAQIYNKQIVSVINELNQTFNPNNLP